MRETKKLVPLQFVMWTAVCFILGCGISGCGGGSTSAAMRGQELFQNCAPCHQTDGSGNSQIGAPNIAGMKAWYVQEEGMRMRPMAVSLPSDEDVKLVAEYVETMPQVRHPQSLPGDAQAGAALFATCASCHGDNGAGNKDLKAPQLAGVDDWYLATELRKFRAGARGVSAQDREGRLMRPMARTLADEEAIRNVLAYIGTLKP